MPAKGLNTELHSQNLQLPEVPMRTLLSILLCIAAFSITASPVNETAVETETLVIYTYDSFVSEWGPGPAILSAFEEKTGIKVEVIAAGDANTILSRAISEKDAPQADILLGLDNTLVELAVAEDLIEYYSATNIGNAPQEIIFKDNSMVPFDYGFFAVIYDSQTLSNVPTSLEDLTKDEYKDSLILMDPRTSSPGLGFLSWTVAVYGDDYLDYWKRLKPSILTITDGWSQGYGAFTNGEAPMVLSYTTSPAYHLAFEETDRYQAAIFTDGHVAQIEGAALSKNAPNRDSAVKFLEFILEDDFQNVIPLTNFMFPASEKTMLPEAWSIVPAVEKIIRPEALFTAEEINKTLDEWARMMAE